MDNRSRLKSPSRILIIKLSALGDIVQTLPVLDALKKTWPQASVDWITGEVGAGLLEGHPLLDRVIVYPRKRLGRLAKNPLSWPHLTKEILGLKKELRLSRYDAALDLQGLFKSGIITILSGAKIKAGFDKGREFSHMFLNKRLPPYDPDKHAVLRYLDLARTLGAHTKDIRFPLGISDTHRQMARDILGSLGIEPGRFVILIPGTIWPTKRWVNSYFAELAVMINKGLGLKSVIVGGSQDRAMGREIENFSKKAARDLTGKTDLKTLAAIFQLAKTAVSTDTGPMHLAAATGLRLVALFGPTAPWRTGPFGHGHKVIRRELGCSPCFKRRCQENLCMKEIGPKEVFQAVKELCK